MKSFLWRFSFTVNRNLLLICCCVFLVSFAVTLWVMLADAGYELNALRFVDGIVITMISLGIMLVFYFGANELERWAERSIKSRTTDQADVVQPSEDEIKTERRVTAIHTLNDEDNWSEEDDLELKRRMQEWQDNH